MIAIDTSLVPRAQPIIKISLGFGFMAARLFFLRRTMSLSDTNRLEPKCDTIRPTQAHDVYKLISLAYTFTKSEKGGGNK